MNREEIAGRVRGIRYRKAVGRDEQIGFTKWGENTQFQELMLLLDFIRHVERSGSKRLRDLATEVLKVRE